MAILAPQSSQARLRLNCHGRLASADNPRAFVVIDEGEEDLKQVMDSKSLTSGKRGQVEHGRSRVSCQWALSMASRLGPYSEPPIHFSSTLEDIRHVSPTYSRAVTPTHALRALEEKAVIPDHPVVTVLL